MPMGLTGKIRKNILKKEKMIDFISSDGLRYLVLTSINIVAIIAGYVFVKHFSTNTKR
jgi:hypothetical protein